VIGRFRRSAPAAGLLYKKREVFAVFASLRERGPDTASAHSSFPFYVPSFLLPASLLFSPPHVWPSRSSNIVHLKQD
jgi:hypothetical protein